MTAFQLTLAIVSFFIGGVAVGFAGAFFLFAFLDLLGGKTK